jgi:sugar phosphate isomerase/epimerase
MTPSIAVSGTEYSHRPLHEVLECAERLGVGYLELWIPHNFLIEDLGTVGRELGKRNLRAAVISTWTQLNLPGDVTPRQTLINQSIDAARALGAPSVNTYFGANPGRSPDEAIAHYADSIAPCLEKAEKAGVFVTLENEFEPTGTDISRRAHLLKLLFENVASPRLRLNYDPCNFYFAGEEPYPYAYSLLREYIGYVHIKNGTRFSRDLYPAPEEGYLWKDLSGEYICCHLGEGAIPFERLLPALVEGGYSGFLGLEPHVPPARLPEAFDESLSFIRGCLSMLSKEISNESRPD